MPSRVRDTIATYDAAATLYLERERRRDRSIQAPHLRAFAESLSAGDRVLDLGSGPGLDAEALRDHGLAPIGLDRSLGMLRVAAKGSRVPRVRADMSAIPLRTSSLAGVWANASLIHLSRERFARALAEVSRVLTSGGVFFLSMKRGAGEVWEREEFGSPRWFQFWSAADLDQALGSGGFSIRASSEVETAQEAWLTRLCVTVE